jgi:uncharacterized protein
MGLAIKVIDCAPAMCGSCYENRIRKNSPKSSYDIQAMCDGIDRYVERMPESYKGGQVTFHGGEPLCLSIDHLEKLAEKVKQHPKAFRGMSVQTNGLLITDAHIEFFKRHGISIGFSIDGDTAELNFGRWNARPMAMDAIQAGTDQAIANIAKCKKAGLSVSIMVVLRKHNASPTRLPAFIKFLERMEREFGIKSIKTNPMIAYDIDEALGAEELGAALCTLADECFKDATRGWLPFRDVVDALCGYTELTNCNFRPCDVWKTTAEETLMKDGSIGCCLKGPSSLDGLQILAGTTKTYERTEALRQIPQEENGCKDCRYWFMCHGGCPGSGVDHDYRNKTAGCEAWKILFRHVEEKIRGLFPNMHMTPSFAGPPKPECFSASFGAGGSTWQSCRRRDPKASTVTVAQTNVNTGHGDSHGDSHGDREHGDHSDAGRVVGENIEHGDKPYSDRPHGDIPHGDSA